MNHRTLEIESHEEDVGNEYNIRDNSYLSPWISLGCISPKTIYYTSKKDTRKLIFNKKIFKHVILIGLHDILYMSLLKRDWCKYLGYFYGFRIFSQVKILLI